MKFEVKMNQGQYRAALNKLNRLPSVLKLFLHEATVQTVRKVEKYVKVRAPKVTGDTARQVSGVLTSHTSGEVGTNQIAAAAIDQGARPHGITPKTAKALAIPMKTRSGRYKSLSKKTSRGGAKYYRSVQYKDAAGAPNKRHLDVKFSYASRVKHPGKKPQPFMTPGAMVANRLAVQEGNKAAGKALKSVKR